MNTLHVTSYGLDWPFTPTRREKKLAATSRQRSHWKTAHRREEELRHLTVGRVLSVDDGAAKVETTFETVGVLQDVRYTALGTLWSFIRPDGTLYGELKGGLRSDDNDTGVYRGITGGKYLADTKHGRTYRGAITFENTVGALAALNSALAVFELEIDDSNKVNFRTWELV
jgi:hypothetical protein